MSTILHESITDAPVRKGNRWRVIVAKPGTGSSGKYSEELFRRDGHKIIPKGGQAFINHDDSRNPKDMIGIYPEGSFWSEEDHAVVSELETFSHWKEFVEEVGPHCGMSLYAMGEQDDDGNVTAILEDALNGCDLVARPGLIGSGLAEKLYESARSQIPVKPEVTSASEKERITMDEEMKAAFKSLVDLITPLVATEKAAKAEAAQAEADEKAVEAAVSAYDAAVKAIDEADLLAPQVEALRAEARKGNDVTPLIEQHKAIKAAAVDAAKAEDAPPVGRTLGERKVESATDLGKVFG